MKLKQLMVSLALITPLAVAPVITSATSVQAATTKQATKTHAYVLADAKFYKYPKAYQLKSTKTTVHQAMFMADQPVTNFDAGKPKTFKTNTVKVDQKIVVKVSKEKVSKLLKDKQAYKAAKNATYYHIQKTGWVKASTLTK
ncbi:hypothetical protein ACYATM_00540 [Lactobacillaceae bacterium Scapto_B20]